MLETIYNFLLPVLYVLLRFIALFSARLKVFLVGRDHLLERWQESLAKISAHNRIWFHVSSVGELEEIRPVLERLNAVGKYTFVLSYYSPSVPRLVKDWSFVAAANYLPLDFRKEMMQLAQMIRPQMLVLNRYDLWPNLLHAARKEGIPVALLNASTPPLGVWGKLSLWFRRSLFLEIFLWTYVDSVAAAAWEPYVRKNVLGLVAGNPRVDRALLRVEEAVRLGKTKEILSRWEHEKKLCIVAGSTWQKDEEVLLEAFHILRTELAFPQLKLILVPHEPSDSHVREFEKTAQKHQFSTQKFSSLLQQTNKNSSDILIVDARGALAEIYGEASVSYVGGGFGKEVHSVIEPLAHGVPVAFGPHHHRSPEAKTLAIMDGAFVVESTSDAGNLALWCKDILENQDKARRAKEAMRVYLQIHRGAGERVGDFLAEQIKIH